MIATPNGENEAGETWSIPRLISEEIRQPILRTAACGGTHRLMGLSYAVRKREKQGGEIEGEWARAAKYTTEYRNYAYTLQNNDGSFSTKWFERRQAEQDIDRRVKTSGHVLEWLVFSIDEDEIFSRRIVKAVDYLARTLDRGGVNRTWEPGPLGHAIHALRIYDRRAFGGPSRSAPAQVAARQRSHSGRRTGGRNALGREPSKDSATKAVETTADEATAAAQQHQMLLNRNRQRLLHGRRRADRRRTVGGAVPGRHSDSAAAEPALAETTPVEHTVSDELPEEASDDGAVRSDDDDKLPVLGPALVDP